MHSLLASNALGTVIGAIERALGVVLADIYAVTHSYALAVILLTVGVRALLIPLTAKQFRSMSSMQTVQPEIKKIQQKYKQLQQKAKDRMEVQQLRMQMNQEFQALYKAHGVNPLGSCWPTLAQFPVLIAMFAIMRASIFAVPGTVGPTAPNFGSGVNLRNVICRPVDQSGAYVAPQPKGPTPTTVRCADTTGAQLSGTTTFTIGELHEGRNGEGALLTDAGWITQCRLTGQTGANSHPMVCHSAVGSGQLPRDSKLFADVTRDKASILGMHPGCTPAEVISKSRIQECFASGKGGTVPAIPYLILVLVIVISQYVMSKQMMSRASGPQLQQQQMMTRIMPLFLGFISYNIPAGANLYYVVYNVWQIGQQEILLKKDPGLGTAGGGKPAAKALSAEPPAEEAKPEEPKKPVQGSKKRKRKKKR